MISYLSPRSQIIFESFNKLVSGAILRIGLVGNIRNDHHPSCFDPAAFGCTFVASNCCASWAWGTPKYVDGVGFYYVLDLRIILIAKSVDLTFTAQNLKDKNSPPWVVNNFHQPRQPPCVFFQSFWSSSVWFIVLQMPSAVATAEDSNAISSHIGWLRGTRRLDNMVTWWLNSAENIQLKRKTGHPRFLRFIYE